MSPVFTVNDETDIRAANAEAGGKLSLTDIAGLIESPDFNNLRGCELGVNGAFAPGMTPLRALIGGIDRGIAKKEMGGIHTRRVIAAMKHAKPVRNRPIGDFPRNAMGKHISMLSVPADSPVAVWVSVSNPQQAAALIRWANIPLKSNLYRDRSLKITTGLGAEAASSLAELRRINKEGDVAGFAGSWDFVDSHLILHSGSKGQARRGASTSRSGRFYYTNNVDERM